MPFLYTKRKSWKIASDHREDCKKKYPARNCICVLFHGSKSLFLDSYVEHTIHFPIICQISGTAENLKDRQGRAVVRAKIRRLEMGNPGKCRSVGQGVMELKIDFGPGYRVYYGEDGDTLVILLCGGQNEMYKTFRYFCFSHPPHLQSCLKIRFYFG